MFFFPQLVEEKQSIFNHKIQVYKSFGKYSLSADNLTQSGGLTKTIWHKALKRFTIPCQKAGRQPPKAGRQPPKADRQDSRFKNSLILGLGGGTAAKLVNQFWPQAQITGIEIDPVMINLGKKYFELDKIKNLKIINTDAFKQIHLLPATEYQLILIDLYQGKTFPRQTNSSLFLRRIKKLLAPRGITIFNRLNYKHNESEIEQYIAQLKQIFPQVTSKKILSNVLVFCSSPG